MTLSFKEPWETRYRETQRWEICFTGISSPWGACHNTFLLLMSLSTLMEITVSIQCLKGVCQWCQIHKNCNTVSKIRHTKIRKGGTQWQTLGVLTLACECAFDAHRVRIDCVHTKCAVHECGSKCVYVNPPREVYMDCNAHYNSNWIKHVT